MLKKQLAFSLALLMLLAVLAATLTACMSVSAAPSTDNIASDWTTDSPAIPYS